MLKLGSDGPEVDVLIPVRNAQDTVAQALASIQEQTLENISIVVVDDGSTDDTGEVLISIARTEPRLRIVSASGTGVVNALNTGLALCSAPLLARQDADDISHPHRLARQCRYMLDQPDCVALGANVRHIDAAGRDLGSESRVADPSLADPFQVPSREPYIIHPLLMTRLSAVRAVGGYRHVWHAEDTDLYWRLQHQGRLHNEDIVLADHRLHDRSVSNASVTNGRIAALHAQLASISEQRHRQGLPELVFPPDTLKSYEEDVSLDAMFVRAAAALTETETSYLKMSTAAKMLELISYRSYPLEEADRRFIRSALPTRGLALPPNSREAVAQRRVWAMAALLKRGRVRPALSVTPAKYWMTTALHLARGRVRRLARGFQPTKPRGG